MYVPTLSMLGRKRKKEENRFKDRNRKLCAHNLHIYDVFFKRTKNDRLYVPYNVLVVLMRHTMFLWFWCYAAKSQFGLHIVRFAEILTSIFMGCTPYLLKELDLFPFWIKNSIKRSFNSFVVIKSDEHDFWLEHENLWFCSTTKMKSEHLWPIKEHSHFPTCQILSRRLLSDFPIN